MITCRTPQQKQAQATSLPSHFATPFVNGTGHFGRLTAKCSITSSNVVFPVGFLFNVNS
eukprot:m.123849 g.123849  ORF g.123849 m.123849 type:complete len:59 (-) comp29017_c0_seq1:679-855(-)